ncbi:DUF5047 domain-containing protein [Streptomyces sp. NPDC050095]|uniref:DUF5047 domain-containing protein n=1 Tax=unclassified Streptomyces TaxID=2593676 RepID=UPI003429328C
MRAVPPRWREMLAVSHGVNAVVTPYLGGVVNGPTVPLLDGEITYDDTAMIRRRLALTVPARTMDRTSWDPGRSTTHPLAAYGQRLRVQCSVSLPSGATYTFAHGWYLISGWELDDDEKAVSVTGVDLSQLIVDDRLLKPSAPVAGGTYASEFTRLLADILTTDYTHAPANGKVNPRTIYDRDRDAELTKLATAWGARWFVDDQGRAAVWPAYAPLDETTQPDVEITDGATGHVVQRTRSAERGRQYNTIVVNGKQPDDARQRAPYGLARLTTGPMRWDGPYGARPRFYSSEMITTDAQAQDTARALLVPNSTVGRSESVTALPDPALELGDVALVRSQGQRFMGRIVSMKLPLTARGGAMDLAVSTELQDDDDDGGE